MSGTATDGVARPCHSLSVLYAIQCFCTLASLLLSLVHAHLDECGPGRLHRLDKAFTTPKRAVLGQCSERAKWNERLRLARQEAREHAGGEQKIGLASRLFHAGEESSHAQSPLPWSVS